MRVRYLLIILLLICGFLVAQAQLGLTQGEDTVCRVFVEQAFAALEQNCAGLERNSICYGHKNLTASFLDGAAGSGFSQPADRQPLLQLQSIQASALDPAQEQWGIAVANVQANVPTSIAGPAVIYLLLGGAQLENAVAPDRAVRPADPVEVRTLLGANLRSGPGTNSSVLMSVPGGTVLLADAFSADRAWLRVVYEDKAAWVSRDLVGANTPLDSLPSYGGGALSPMQKLYFSAAADTACGGLVQPMLVVQGPQNATVMVNINEADIRLSSTMALRILPDNKLQILVLSGGAYIGSLSIPAGFTAQAVLTADGRSVASSWTNFRPMNQEELNQLAFLSQIPAADFMHYAITIPTQQQIQQTLVSLNSGGTGASSGPASGQANCARFKPTSPLDGLAFGVTTFYWDAAPGSTNYRLRIYNENGALVGTFDTSTDNTSLPADTGSGSIGDGTLFGWEVEALVNGQVACTSSRVLIPRQSGAVLAGGSGGGAVPTPTPVGWSGG